MNRSWQIFNSIDVRLVWLLVLSMLPIFAYAAKSSETGEFLGAASVEHPTWFKSSFLDFEEDIADAATEGKRLVVYFWQPGCPYCAALWSENFSDKTLEQQFRDSFEIVAINMWGDREVVNIGGTEYTEKSLAEALQVQYTPTLMFFDEKGKVILRQSGYLPPDVFKKTMAYVAGKNESKMSFAEFSAQQDKTQQVSKDKTDGGIIQEDFFLKPPFKLGTSKTESKPYLAVLFEQNNCKACEVLHQKTLQHQQTRALLKQFDVIQLDKQSDQTNIVLPDGTEQTAKQWYEALKLNYIPAMVFFDREGKEVMRIDSQLRNFHTQSVLDYVQSEAYKTETNFQKYITKRSEHIQEQGKDVDIWEY